MLRDRDIICISSIDWDAHWQIHHQIASSLVAAGNRVLFIENTGVRRPGMRDLSRMRQRVVNWWRSTKGFREASPKLFVYSPLFLPFPYSSIARWFNRVVLFRGVKRWMAAVDFRRPIVWTFLPTPLAQDLMRELDSSLVIYYCADDFAATSPGARRVSQSEERLFRSADLVFVTSERLRQKAAQFSANVHAFPAGVDFARFEAARHSSDGLPADLDRLPRPLAGYVGALHQWVDQDLLVNVTEQLPDVTFAFIGPAQVDVSRLSARPNVKLLGPRAHPEIPAYVKGFDVALVPYSRSDFTESVYPVKLNEYLAMGVPVVTTDLPEIDRFNDRHGAVLTVARNATDFARGIRHALEESRTEHAAARVAVAKANSWSHRLEAMSALIEQALERRAVGERGWEQRLRKLYASARSRVVQVLTALAIVYFILFHTPFVFWTAEPLRVSEPPRAADAIVVFAGGVGESGEAGGGYQERVKEAVDLYQAGHARRMIFSSGFVFAFKEAEVMRTLAISSGVPESAIVLEQKAGNTRDMVRFAADILSQNGWRTVLLVSSPYHMRRAMLTWRRAAPSVTVIPTPVSQSQFYAPDGSRLAQIRGILHEYAAIATYWFRGWL
jgi:uncharacterized SAM-binding protein YcdF (DUF218 family)/glycosyltransferase involved in cell wall biosynthesis